MLPVAAATTQDKIQDARNAKSQTESSLDETQSRIQALESKKGESEAYLEELNAQLTDLKNSLEELQQQSADKQAEPGESTGGVRKSERSGKRTV